MITAQRMTKYELHEHYMRVRARINRRIVEVAKVMVAATVPNVIDPETVKSFPSSMGTMQAIVQHVSAFYNVDAEEVIGVRRTENVVLARQMVCYIARKATGYSLPQIGRKLNRDHTTVLHALTRIQERMKEDPEFAEAVEEMVGKFTGYSKEVLRQFSEKQAQYPKG